MKTFREFINETKTQKLPKGTKEIWKGGCSAEIEIHDSTINDNISPALNCGRIIEWKGVQFEILDDGVNPKTVSLYVANEMEKVELVCFKKDNKFNFSCTSFISFEETEPYDMVHKLPSKFKKYEKLITSFYSLFFKDDINESTLKQISKGDCNSKIQIHGIDAKCSPSNCGAIFEYNNKEYEAMSKKFSSHKDNIVSLYVYNNSAKVEISCWKVNDAFKFGLGNYKTIESVETSRYSNKIGSKWEKYLPELEDVYNKIFKD